MSQSVGAAANVDHRQYYYNDTNFQVGAAQYYYNPINFDRTIHNTTTMLVLKLADRENL